MWTVELPQYCDQSQTAKYRPLSREDQELVTNLLKDPPTGISGVDLSTLEDGEWVSDNVIEQYLAIIQKSAPKTCKVDYFNYTVYKQLRTRKDFTKYKSRQKTQKVYYPKKKWVVLFDSLQVSCCINQLTAFERAKRFLTFYFPESELNWDDWTFYMPSADYAFHLANKIPLNFSQQKSHQDLPWLLLEVQLKRQKEGNILRWVLPGKPSQWPGQQTVDVVMTAVENWAMRPFELAGKVLELSSRQAREFIRGALEAADRRKDNGPYEFSIQGSKICARGWCLAFGVKKSRFYEMRAAYEKGEMVVPDLRNGMKFHSRRYLEAKEWLTEYAKKYGDIMPNSNNTHLPQCLQKIDVFNSYCEDMSYENHLKLTRFKVMWNKEFPNLKIPPRNRFTKCDECEELKKQLKEAKIEDDFNALRERRQSHLQLANSARQKYYKHIKKAKQYPDNYLSIIIDSMDQNKTSLPHFSTPTKNQTSLQQMKIHLTGVLAHGQRKSYVYAWTSKYRMDVNITTNVLIDVLTDISKEKRGRLPSTLYLQLDNSAKENKNKFMIAFCTWLVKLQIFQKVKLGYLMAGHTHEDIDQMFSRFSVRLQRQDATTVTELFRCIEASYAPQPQCRLLQALWDYRTLMSTHITADMSGHSRPHNFVMRAVDNKVNLLAQLWPVPTCPKVDISVDTFVEEFCAEFCIRLQNSAELTKSQRTNRFHLQQPDCNIDLRLGDNITVKEGTTIDIGARIKGKPDLQVTWTADENAFTEGGSPRSSRASTPAIGMTARVLEASERVIMTVDAPKARLEVMNARRSDRGKYAITVSNKAGKKSSSINVNVLAKPGPPTKLNIDEITNSYAILNWEPPEDDGGSPVLNYVVHKKDTARNVWAPVAEAYPVAKQTIHIPNLLEGSEYVFRVQAENQIGIGRPNDSMPIVARWRYRVPDAPDAPSISDIRRNAMTATWREPFNGGSKVTGYYLEKKEKDASRWLPVNQEPIPSKTHRITGLLEGMDYVFRVKAENRAGVGPPGPPSRPQKAEDPIDPPGPVVDPECYEVTRSSASIRWKKPETDGGSRILGYIVEKRKADSDLWTSCHDTEMHRSLELVVPSLLTGQKYVFRVCAANRAGHGPWEAVPGTILIKEREEPLVLNLDASFKELYVLRAGSVLRIPVMIGGRPEPKIEWFKEGQKTHGRTLIENTAISTTLLIKNCYKSDAGEYMLRISNQSGKKECRVQSGKKECRVQVRVVDKPSVPLNLRSKPEEITSDMIPLYWDAPEDDGGAKITHYIVEKREAKRAAWASVCNTVRTTCIAPELVEKMVYEFRVRAVNEIGEGENALSGKIRCQPPLSPPGPPLMLDVEDTSKDSILLDWDPPREDGGSKILGYFVEMKGPDDTDWRKVNMESFTSSRWEVKGLRDDVDYDFQVKATNAIGVGPPSEPITGARCFELPSAPAIDLAISMRDLVVVKAGTPIKLHARIEGYPYPSAQWLSKRVVKAGTPIKLHARIEGYPYPSAQWLSKGEPLEAGDRYSMKTTKSTAELVVKPSLRSDTGRYHLVVKNLAGTRKAPINVKVLDRPGPPQAPVQFEDIHQDQVTLRWSVPADDGGTEVTNYIVERREAAKTFWTTVNSNLSRTRIMVPKLIEGTPYVFRIKAENKMGISDPLDSEPVTPKSPYDLPGPPLELRIINVQSDTMSLTWLEPDFDGGSPVQGYFLEKRDKISKRWLKIEKDMLTTTTYKVGGLIEGFSYEFRVSAKNVVGTGPPSEPTFPTVARPPLDPPDPPLEPHVVDQTRSTVDLEWDEPVYDGSLPIEGYLVEHRLKGVETWTKSHDTSMVANMYYTVAGLEEGREYQFRVFAINGAGKSKPAEVPGFTVVRDITTGKSKPAEVPGFTVVRDITIYPEIELDASCKDTVYARANQNVRLPVYIKGRPDPKIMWSKEGKDLPGHITIEKLAIGEVLKMKVSRPDSGRYTVQVSNVCGEVSKNINLVVLDRPGPPRNIVVKYVKKDSCVLNWDIPEDDGGSQITNYIVERRLPNENLWRNVTSNIRSRVSKVTGLNEGYSYFFRVKAENKYGIGLPVETTEPTLAADPIDRPTEPRDLEVTAVTNNSVSLKWVKPTYDGGSPLTTYLVERCRLGESDHTRINTDDLLETEYTATGLNPGAKYEFRVKARNIRYIGPPSTPTPFIEARDDTKPPKIELDLRLLDVLVVRAGTKVHLEGRISGVPLPAVKWSRGGKEIATSDHYEVTTIDKETCLTLRSARRRDTGSYDVNVTNSAGAMNATAKVIVQDVPGPPVGPLKIRDMTSESMTIEWKMPHDDGGAEVTSYLVEKMDTKIGHWFPVDTTVTKFSLKKMDTKIGHWFPVDTTVTKFSLKVTQLMEDHEYQFRIRGRNKIGLGEPFVSKPRIAKRPYDLPGPPSAPIVHTIFPDNATLIWQPPESDGGSEISRYILEKKDINSIKWVRAVETISSDTRYNVPNLVEGMEYQFRAAAENAAGLGKFGPPSTPVIAREPIDLPDPPVTPKCVDTTRSSATIAWKKPILDGGSDIVGYLVEYRAADSENWEIGTPKIHTLQFVVTELTEGAEYYFRVSAINEAGVGPPGDCPGKVLIKDILASPDFELDATSPDFELDASMKKTLTVRAGQPIRMYVSISGRPQPEIHWEKEGQPLDYRAEVENTEYSSQLAIYNTNRYDAGRYDLILKNAVGEKTASVNVKVFDTPGPPGPIAIKEVSKDHMVITWTPPTVDGGSAVSNYIVEKRDESRRTWTTVTTNNPKLSCRIPNLVETVTYFFQVFAENKYGIGEPSESMPAKAQDAVGPPGPVVKLHVADITRITAFLEWTKPTFDGGSKVTGYVVETQEAGSIEWDKAGVATECHYQVLGLTPGHGYRFRVKAQNAAGQGDPTDTEIHKAQDEKIAPKINLDVTMRETVVVKAGHTLTIYAGISGKPVPHTRWAKDGAMMKPDRRLLFKKSHTETRFSLKEVTRNDAGTYALRAYNDAGEKTANVFVKVLDKPGPPASLQIDEVTADSVSISWRPPTDNGGVEVNNYLVERCDVQRGVWLTVNANVTRFMFKFPDLMKGREYAFRVMAENRIGVGEPAATEKVVARDAIEPPGPPSAPEITEICKDAIGFAWEPPKYDGGSAITGYIIERREKQSRRWIKLNREAIKKREYRSEGLLEGFEYDFRVRAVNQAGTGDPSEPSVPVRAEEQISPPRNLRVIDYSRSFVTIAWEPPEFDAGSKILGYFIWRRNIDFKGWAPCNEKIWTDRRFHIKALTENKKYLFMVKAKNAAGMISLPATIGPVETKDEFEPPKILLSETFKDVITVKAGETVNVNINFTGRPRPRATWEKDDSTLTLRDRIRVETTPENSLLTLEKTERADTGKYTLSVRNEAGQRNAIVRLIVQDKPSPPQAPVETSKVSGETCMVKWKPPKDDGGSPIHSYIIEKRDTTRQVWTRAATVDAGKLSAQVTKLTRGQQYVMRVSAQNAIGTSDPQIGEPFLARDFFDVPGPPGQPQIIKVCKKYVHLTWTPPINDGGSKVTGYLIERSDLCPSITTFWIRCVDEVIKDTEYVIYNLFEGCDYEFRVTACNAAGWGIPSEGSDEVKVRDPVAPPVAPGRPELVELTKSSIKLNWSRPYYDGGSPIIGYILESRKEGQEEWARVHRPEYIIDREWTLKDLTEGTKYDFRVFALNDAGQSEASENSGIIEVKEIIIPADVEPDASLWRTQIVRAGTALRLFVPIKGKPTPEITWTKGEENLEERANITNTDTASLFVLPNMQRLDAGKYCITAENKAGKKSSFINVKVLGPPGPPGPIKVKDITKDSCIIQWSAPDDDGGADVFNYIVEKKEQQKNTYRITNLVETCTYYFRVIGENKYGIGEAVETEEPICALDPVEPPEKPKNLTVEEVTPATVSLAWKRPDWDGGSRISGYLVEYLAPNEEEWTKAATARNVNYTVFGLDRDATYRFRVTTLTELSQSVPAELPEPITCKEEQLAPTLDLSSIKGDTLIVKGGTDLTITIPVRGAPDPTVAWMHGLQKIQEKGRYFTKKTREFTRLQIKKTKKEDGGKFTITAENAVGSTSAVFNLKVLDKPGPPSGPVAFDDITDESVMLSWEPPKDDGGSEVTHYVVEKSDVRTAQWQYVSSEVRRTHLKVTGLNKGAQYQFRISAENRFGVGTPLNSGNCYIRAPFDVPEPPQNLKVVSVTKSQITIAYEPPENDGGAAVTGYMVERKEKNSPRWIKATKMPISDTEYSSLGLMEGLQYMHRVRAVNQAGTGPACDPTPLVIAMDPIAPPRNLEILEVSSKFVHVQWKKPIYDGGARITGYVIEARDVRSDKWVKCHLGEVLKLEHVITDIKALQKYQFRVKAKNEAGNISEPSNLAGPVLTKDDLQPPTITLDAKIKDNKIQVHAGDKLVISGFAGGKPTPTMIFTKGRLVLRSQGRVSIDQKGKAFALCVGDSSRADAGEYTITAENNSGSVTVTVKVLVMGKPGPPMGLQVLETTPETCTVSWQQPEDDGGAGITNYVIEKMDLKTKNWKKVSGAVRKTTFKIPKLIPFNEYQFRVSAQNMFGVGDPATTGNVLARHPFDTPGPPVHVQVREITRESLKLLWSPPENDGGSEIVGFLVERKEKTSVRWERLNKEPIPETRFRVEDLEEGLEYEFRISAVNAAGVGKPSAPTLPITAQDPVDKPGPPGPPEVEDTTRSSISLTWTKPTSDGRSKIIGYVLEMQPVGTEEWTKVHTTSTIKLLSYVVDELTENKEYVFRVSAVNAVGVSEPSASTAPTAARERQEPPEVEVDASMKRSLTVRAGNPIRFYVGVKGRPAPTCTWEKEDVDLKTRANIETTEYSTTMTIATANRDDAGKYELTVENPHGKKTVGTYVKVYDTPGPPEEVVVKGATSKTAVIDWDPPSKDGGKPVIGYILEKKEVSRRTWDTIDSDIVKTCYRVTDLVEGNQYFFRVLAVNDFGIGDPGETEAPTLAIDPADQPEPPRNFHVTEITPNSVSLAWKKPDYDGGAPITSYVVEMLQFVSEEEEGEWRKCTQINALRYTVADLLKGEKYRFRVSAQNYGAVSKPAELLQPVVAKEQIFPPAFDLQGITSDTIMVKEGSDFVLKIPYSGQPVPTVTWKRGLGVMQQTARIFTKTTRELTQLFIKRALKADSGQFSVNLANAAGSQQADFQINVLGKPLPPEGPVEFEDVSAESVTMNWKPPTDDGGSEVTNYVIEKSDNRGIAWVYVSSGVKRTTMRVTKLTKGKIYAFRISAENRFGVGKPIESPYITAKDPYDIPGPPGVPETHDVTREQMCLTWPEPADNGGSPVTGYVIERKEMFSNRWVKLNRAPVRKNEFTSTQLTEGKEYEFRVCAVNAAGVGPPSEPSRPRKAVDPVGIPRNVEILEITRSSVTLSWARPTHDGGSKLVSYIIERRLAKEEKWTQHIHSDLGNLTYAVKGLKQGEKYVFRVCAKNAAGTVSDPSHAVGPIICKDDLAPPKILLDTRLKEKVTVAAGSAITLAAMVSGKPQPEISWSKGTRTLVGTNRMKIDSTARSTQLAIKDCCRADSGKYTLTAINGSGSANISIQVTVLDRPGPPTGPIQVGEVTPETAVISWAPPADDGGAEITNYVVQRSDVKQPDVWIKVSAAVRKTTHKITKLNLGTTYCFRVRAQNMNGIGDALASEHIEARYPFDTPSAPGQPQVKDLTAENCRITWTQPETDGGSEITGYIVEKKEKNSIRWERINRDLVQEMEYMVLDLEEGLEYSFRVCAVNMAGRGKASPQTMPTVAQDPLGKPGSPVNAEVVDTTRTSAELKWEPPIKDGGSKILGYIVEARKEGTEEWLKAHATSLHRTTEYVVPDLVPGGFYKFRVSAVNQVGVGEPAEIPGVTEAKDILEIAELDPSVAKHRVTVRAGTPLRIYVPIKGKPTPTCTWAHEESDLENRAQIETSEVATQLLIMPADLRDAGLFHLTVENSSGKAEADINVRVLCKLFHLTVENSSGKAEADINVRVLSQPGPPENVEIKSFGRESAVIDWDPPSKDGGKPVTNYILEKKEISRKTWTVIDANIVKTCYTALNLVEGNQYFFRVFAENDFGIGEPGETVAPMTAMDPIDQPDPPKRVKLTEVTSHTVSLAWEKPDYDGGSRVTSYIVEMLPEDRTEEEGWIKCSQLNTLRYTVTELERNAVYRFRVSAQNAGAVSEPRELPDPVVCKEPEIPPSMDLSALQSQDFVLKESSDFALKIPYAGLPKPKVTWLRGLGPLKDSGRIFTKTLQDNTTLFIKRVTKADTGSFTLNLENLAGSQSAEFKMKVVGKPTAPQMPIEFDDVQPDSVTLSWKPPDSDGGSEVTNYIIEKSDNRGATWVYVSSGVKRTICKVGKLVRNKEYSFRISAENRFGVGPPIYSTSVGKLVRNKEYSFRISAENRFGVGPPIYSTSVLAKEPYDPPDAPTGLETFDVTKEQICLRWQAPANDGGSMILGYLVERSERGSQRWTKLNRAPVRKTDFRCSHLMADHEYEFRVCAVNAAGPGPFSEESPYAKTVDPVGPPQNVQVVDITRSSVTLEWRRPAFDGGHRIIGYQVFRREVSVQEPKWVECLKKGGKYEFQVVAKNSAGIKSAPSDKTLPVVCKDNLVPPAIVVDYRIKENKMAISEGDTLHIPVAITGRPEPEVSWTRNGKALLKSQRVDIAYDGKKDAHVHVKESGRIDAGEYIVTAKNDSGIADATINVNIFATPGKPLGPLVVADVTPESCLLRWEPPEDDGGATITNFIVERMDVKQQLWIKVSSAVRRTSLKVSKLSPGQTYQFRVFAVNVHGVGEPLLSEAVIAKYQFDVPGQPGQPQVSDVTREKLNLSWTAPLSDGGSDIIGYVVDMKERTSVRWQRITRRSIQELKLQVDGLEEGLDYEFRVVAENTAGFGKPSPLSAPVIVQDPVGLPDPPTDVEVFETTKTTNSVRWQPPARDGGSRIQGYVLEMLVMGQEEWKKCHTKSVLRICEFVVDGLTTGPGYRYRVSAVNDIGMGKPAELPGWCQARDMEIPPLIKVDPSAAKSMKVHAGMPLRIQVPLFGKPQPTANWIKEDSDLENRAQVETTETHTTIMLPACDRRDAGVWEMFAENPFGTNSWSINVKVMACDRRDAGVWEMFAENPFGTNSWSIHVKVMDTPGAPENIECKGVTSKSCIVDWDPPSKDGGKPVNNYILEKKIVGRHTWSTVDDNIVKTAYTVYNLIEGNQYLFRIIAENDFGYGEPGELDKPVTAADPVDQPDPPKKFEVTETSPTHISLRWTKPDYDGGSRITSYIVEMRFTDSEEWVKCTQINALRYTITDVIPNQDYMLRIFAQNTGAMSNPKEIGPVTAKEPIMPATLDLSAIPGDEVIVKQGSDWTISIPYHGYPAPTAQWFRGMGDLRETNRVSTKTGGGVTMLNIRQVIKADGGKYSVQVSNPAGSQTADINVKIIGRPGPPNGPVVIEDVTPESCVLNWKPPTDDGGSDVTNYVIEKSDNRGATWVYVSSGVKRTQLKVTKLTENKEYLFKISAENRFGVGSPLKSESMVAKLPYDPPSEPRNPKVSEVQRDSMTITWEESASDGGSDITGYIVERKERNSNRWVKINRVPMKHLTVRSMGLLEGCEYEHRVIAYNAAGPSKHSEATPLTLAKDPVSAPRRVEIVDITRSSVSLEWLAPESEGGARIIGYWVDRFNPEEGKFITCNQIMIPASERHFTVKGLRQGSKYEFCVRAKNAAGIISAPSDKTIPVICKDDLQPPSVSLAYMTKDTMTFKAGEDMDLSMSVKGKPVPDIVWLKGIRPLVKSD
ncbi:Titin-like, partial [Branchiostoma belcheri]